MERSTLPQLWNAVLGAAGLITGGDEAFNKERLEDYFVHHETNNQALNPYSEHALQYHLDYLGVSAREFFEQNPGELLDYTARLVQKVLCEEACYEEKVFCYGVLSRSIPNYVGEVKEMVLLKDKISTLQGAVRISGSEREIKSADWYSVMFYQDDPADSEALESQLLMILGEVTNCLLGAEQQLHSVLNNSS